MKDFLSLRKESFGGTLFNPHTGKRVYLNVQETKDFIDNRVLPTDVEIVKDAKNTDINIVENINSKNPLMFSFADTIYIELTRKCNLRCKHCLNSSGHCVANELTKEEVLSLIEELYKCGVQEIRFTGGEPLLFDGIFEAIQLASQKGLKTSLGTNGTLVTPKVAKKLKEVGLSNAVVSIDGTKEMHDSIRGEGNFDKSMEGLHNLMHEGIDVRVNSVIMKNNIEEIIALAKDLDSQKIKLFIRQFVSSGRGKDLVDVALSAEEYKQVKERLAEELNNNVRGHNLKNNNGTTSRIPLNFEISTCRAAQRTLCITPEGNVYPCGFLAAQGFSPLDNIRNIDSWEEFWFKLNNIAKLKDLRERMAEYNKTHEKKITCMADFYSKIVK